MFISVFSFVSCIFSKIGTFAFRMKDGSLRLCRNGIEHQTKLYRQLQLLVKLFNNCFQDLQMPNMFIIHGVINVMCLFVVIELRNSLNLVEALLYPYMLFICVIFDVVVMEYASKPASLSKAVKNHWRKFQFLKEDQWLSRYSVSCPILRIYTAPTPLTVGRERLAIFFRFCLQRTLFFVVYHRKP